MKRAVDILRQLRAEAPDSGTDYNRGYHEALNELEERILEELWEDGIEAPERVYREIAPNVFKDVTYE